MRISIIVKSSRIIVYGKRVTTLLNPTSELVSAVLYGTYTVNIETLKIIKEVSEGEI